VQRESVILLRIHVDSKTTHNDKFLKGCLIKDEPNPR